MPIYHRLGQIPRKRHSVFRKSDGELHMEQLMGNKGFTGPASLLYHLHLPTRVADVRHVRSVLYEKEPEGPLRNRHFRTHGVTAGGSAILDRVPLLFNSDVALHLAQPNQEDEFFYRNGQGDELIYVSAGEGLLESQFGELEFRPGDYLVIPRGIVHRYRFTAHPVRLLVMESRGFVRTPKRYSNEFGQLTEEAPYCERDYRLPSNLQTHDEQGEFPLLVKQRNALTELLLGHHPFDVTGWDGYYYPWAISIHDFEPRVGRFHLPPPVHQSFEGDGFVVCSFCPRLYDFDPEAVPVPYYHANVMSDEVIYYATSEFMSRKGIEFGSITLHPDGLPHGPQPGLTEASIGHKRTDELAVMVDTFRPLNVAMTALPVEDLDYYRSWL
jgi:homogentisate 1,2-dioxygenase